MSDVLQELRELVKVLETKPEEEHAEFAYMRLVDMTQRFRPENQKIGNVELDRAVIAMLPDKIKATKLIRAHLGLTLRESADYLERVEQQRATMIANAMQVKP